MDLGETVKLLGDHELINKTQLANTIFGNRLKDKKVNSFNKYKQRVHFTNVEIKRLKPVLMELQDLISKILYDDSPSLPTDREASIMAMEKIAIKIYANVQGIGIDEAKKEYENSKKELKKGVNNN